MFPPRRFVNKWQHIKKIFGIIGIWKIKKIIFELLENEKIKWIIEFLIFRCFHLGGSTTNDNILRKCWVFIGIWKNQNEFLNYWKMKKYIFFLRIIGKRKNQKNNYWIFRCFHLRGQSTNDHILRKCWVFIGKGKNQKINFWITRMNWRYAPIILAPAGGSDVRDRTPAVRARKHVHDTINQFRIPSWATFIFFTTPKFCTV